MRVALGQFNAIVGDLAGNAEKMQKIWAEAMESNVDLLAFPELAVCGYPPEDLLLKKHFLQDNRLIVDKLAADCPDKTIVVGFAETYRENTYNSAAVLRAGQIERIYRKGLLVDYGVFDEPRCFQPRIESVIINIAGLNVAVTICADIWDIEWLAGLLDNTNQIQMILNISASPFHLGKIDKRQEVVGRCAKKFTCAVSYCNLIGGQDELVFDGSSCFADSTGKLITRGRAFAEDLIIADVIPAADGTVQVKPLKPWTQQPTDVLEEVYQALVLGTRDYARKNGFEKVLLGLSGGIDSSVAGAIAVAALGPENVVGITMPSKFNSPETIADAEITAKNLGIEFLTIPIEPILKQFDQALNKAPGWDSKGIAYENLQARIRGGILMSLSNQYGSLVLTTGNKSETAVGYATLYGDTAGGFAVIKDVPKTMVYKLAQHINKTAGRQIIPADVLNRPPTAELRPGQIDADSLPDYDLLDKILKGYVEEDKSPRQLVESGLPKEVVLRVIRMVDRNEYKRRQSPPGVKITPKAFGKDRRLPITNRYNSLDDKV
ncbi:MAG: NAD+ synthase [Phycisphaerae bacterium]|nr:NAD+ synthase [Phycisphaerae bacterium]NIP54668.1 NAD+ synthase [Phycisphaerae bacterium]NIS53537.1 NAD+ synthase [Phycisphaerae bacterium]NIU10997.1 NAD+ synthase [Phycisphaerae bacterium]NIU58880.1 NAD+ synthase [Phycisphaerae bacterium]